MATMVKKYLLIFTAGILLLSGTVCSHASELAIGSWAGTYEYEATLGKTAGSTPVIIDMTLTLKPDGTCELESEGYMKDEHILCTASQKDAGVEILFKGYSSEQVTHPVGNYRPNDLLFKLTKKDGTLFTRWGKAKPFFRLKDVGKYFE